MSQTSFKPQGYSRIARIMAGDHSAAIFRRFADLQMLNLMSLQAELLELQSQYRIQCQKDEGPPNIEKSVWKNFHKLHGLQGPQYIMLENIRAKLWQYNETLQQVSNIMEKPSPRASDYQEFCDWLSDERGGDCFQEGSEVRTWIDEDDPSLDLSSFISLAPVRSERDIFTNALTKFVVSTYHCVWGEKRKIGKVVDEESGLTSYNESKINMAGTIITTILSSMLPVISILVLYEIQNPYGRIGATIGFTGLFAAMLAIFSSAKRIEVFAATATYGLLWGRFD